MSLCVAAANRVLDATICDHIMLQLLAVQTPTVDDWIADLAALARHSIHARALVKLLVLFLSPRVIPPAGQLQHERQPACRVGRTREVLAGVLAAQLCVSRSRASR